MVVSHESGQKILPVPGLRRVSPATPCSPGGSPVPRLVSEVTVVLGIPAVIRLP